MSPKQTDRLPVPPWEAREFCYRVLEELAKGSPCLDALFHRLGDADFKEASETLQNELANSRVWENDLSGLSVSAPKREGREVEIELVEVVSTMMRKGHKGARLWNAIMRLVESEVLTVDVPITRYGLTASAKRAMRLRKEIDHVFESSGHVVLRTNFQRFQRYLEERKLEATENQSVPSEKRYQSPRGGIPPELRTRRMTLGEAARLLGFKGDKKAMAKQLKAAMNQGQYEFFESNRQSYIFDVREFSPDPAVQSKLRN